MNILKKIICSVMIFVLAFGFTACSNNNADEPAVEFPYAELNEIYDSGSERKGERFEKKNEGRRYIVQSAQVDRVSFKSSTEYDVFCSVKSGERKFTFRLFVDISQGDVTREYINSLKTGDVISFEASFLSQTKRGYMSSFDNVKFITENQ